MEDYLKTWEQELSEVDEEALSNEEYQRELFEEYVLRKTDHMEERRELAKRYRAGGELLGEHGLRKELAAFDLGYFGRAYLKHYFFRKSWTRYGQKAF